MPGKLIRSISKERALVYLASRDKGYARQIARFFAVPLNRVQKNRSTDWNNHRSWSAALERIARES
jgi:hypothetical protein